MLAAIRRVETLRIEEATQNKTRGETTWPNINRARDVAIQRLPDQEAYFATRRLLSQATSGEAGRLLTVQQAVNDVAKDTENLVARLVYAVLLDMHTVESASGSASPVQRAREMREIIDAPPRAEESTFHNASIVRAWRSVLGDYFKRPDVAASLVPPIADTEALPLVCNHVLELRSELSERGATEEAQDCTRWLIECLGGLMLSETDADTRLLCAELIGRTVGADSHVGRDMLAFRRAYHEAARGGPIDRCDQGFTQKPSVAPTEYRRALRLLVACLGVGVAAVGGAVSLLVVCLIAPIARRLTPGGALARPLARSWWSRLPLAVVPTGVFVAAVAVQVDRQGYYSQGWAIVVGLAAVGVGALTTIVLASYCAARVGGSGRIGRIVPWAVLAAFVALPLLPPGFVTQAYRGLDLAVGGLWAGLPVAIGLILLAKWFAPARWGTLGATGALVACLHACLALGFCFWHSTADDAYQRAAVEGHRDEVAARLGPDWQATYLDELLRVFDVPGERR